MRAAGGKVHPVEVEGFEGDTVELLDGRGPPALEKVEDLGGAKGGAKQVLTSPKRRSSAAAAPPPAPKSAQSKGRIKITESGTKYIGMCGFPLIDPKSKFTFVWDTGVALLLLYTAIVTPFEVSFLETSINGLFFFNRGVDFLFFSDMLFNFFRPFQNELGEWVYDHGQIIRVYSKSWFPIDLVSIAPFDVIGLVSETGPASQLKIVRIIRLLRLAKLMRILRAGRMFARWESSMPVDYMKLELSKFLGVVIALAHWLACGWHMAKVIESGTGEDVGDGDNWVKNYGFISETTSNGSKYLAALYWSIATLSTLGYGDVVPTTDAERMYVVIATIVGSSVYAYMIGNVCGMLAGMDVRNAKFYETMKQLNTFMDEKNIPQVLREQLREYFRFRRNHGDISDWHELLSAMSPALREAVSGQVHAKWVGNVACFRDSPPDFMASLALAFKSETFGTRELVFRPGMPAQTLYIVERGVVGVGGRIMNKEKSFGEEMLYSASAVRRMTATTLTHCVFLTLGREELMTILYSFPVQERKMRKCVIRPHICCSPQPHALPRAPARAGSPAANALGLEPRL